MSQETLKLEVLLAAIDKASGPFKSIQKGSGELARSFRAAKDQLKELQTQQANVKAYRDAEKAAAITANAFKGMQDKIRALKEEMAKTPEPAQKMIRALKEAEAESKKLKERHESLMGKQQQLFAQMKAVGVDVSRLADHSRDLASRELEAAAAVRKLGAAFDEQKHKLGRLEAARKSYEKAVGNAARLRGAAYGVSAAGAAIGLPVAVAVKEYATFEEAMLGVARQVEGARDANGRYTATYYEMADAIKAMSERIPMATTEIAAIVEAGARMGIQGKANLLAYAETTAVMADAFNLSADQIGENIARISQLYKIPVKDIKGLGDAINWLDDNALSKGGDIIDVMQRIAGATQMVNMSYREAAALGSSFLSTGAGADVSATATNALIGQLANAPMLATAKRYRGGLEMLGLDAKSLQSGMIKDATGTILKVLEAIKRLPQEQQLEATTRLFGKEYADDVAKLAQNLDEYRRQLGLVNSEEARGSMQREADARSQILNARLQMAKNAWGNLASDLGDKLKPAIIDTLNSTLSLVQGVRDWAKEHPALAGGLMTVAKWVAILVSGLGALMLIAGTVLVPLAALKWAMMSLGIKGALGAVIGGVKALGMAVLMSPLAPWIVVIGIAAGLIYKYWDQIKAFFSALPDRMRTVGTQVMDGLINGFKERWQRLKDMVSETGAAVVGWFKEKLGIKSPSRVFRAIGGYAMEGLQEGILSGQGGPLAALAKASRNLVGAGAGILLSGGAAAMPTMAPGAVGGGMVVQITINAAPGMDTQDLSRQVVAEIRKYESQRAAQTRSRLRDRD